MIEQMVDRAPKRPKLNDVLMQLNEALVSSKLIFQSSITSKSPLRFPLPSPPPPTLPLMDQGTQRIAPPAVETLKLSKDIDDEVQRAQEEFLTKELLANSAVEELFEMYDDARGYSNTNRDEYSVAFKLPLPSSEDAIFHRFDLILSLLTAIIKDYCSGTGVKFTREYLDRNPVVQSYVHNKLSDPNEYIHGAKSLYYSTDSSGLCGAVVSLQLDQKVKNNVSPEFGGLELKTNENNRVLLSAFVDRECTLISERILDLRSTRDESSLTEIVEAANAITRFLIDVKSHVESSEFAQDFPHDKWVDLRPLMFLNGHTIVSAYQRVDNADGLNLLMFNNRFHGLNDSSLSYMEQTHANFEGRFTLTQQKQIACPTVTNYDPISSDTSTWPKIICAPAAFHHFNMADMSSNTELLLLESATFDLLTYKLKLPTTMPERERLLQLCIVTSEYLDVMTPLQPPRSIEFQNLLEQMRKEDIAQASHDMDIFDNIDENSETSGVDLEFLDIIRSNLGFDSLRSNQIAILIQAIIKKKDIIWNGACNTGKTVLPLALAIMSKLGMHDFGENTTIIHFGTTKAFMLNLLDQIQKCDLLKNVVCVPGHREFEHLKLEDAILSKKYRYIITHVSRFVKVCGHGEYGTVHNMTNTEKFDLARSLLSGPFKDFGENLHLVYDEAHSFLQLPFNDIQTSLGLIEVFCGNSRKYVMTATTLAASQSDCKSNESDDGYNNILMTKEFLIKFFKLNCDNVYTRIESSRRSGIQRLTINMANIFTVDALAKSQVMLQSFHLVNIHTLHKYAIILDGILLVYCNGYHEAEKLQKAYELAHASMGKQETCILAGTKYMTTKVQDSILERINGGSSVTICFATNVIALGLNLEKVKTVYHYGDPQDGYAMEQFINRVDRGEAVTDAHAMRPLCVNAIPTASFYSDWQNVTSKDCNKDKFLTDLQGKRLLRSLVCSSKCTNQLLDDYLPDQHIDGVPTERNMLPCNMCPACINGTQEIDFTTAAMLIFLTVEEARETLPAKVIVLILTKGNIKLGSNEDAYFRGDSPIVTHAHSFSTFGRLQHCEVNQVKIKLTNTL